MSYSRTVDTPTHAQGSRCQQQPVEWGEVSWDGCWREADVRLLMSSTVDCTRRRWSSSERSRKRALSSRTSVSFSRRLRGAGRGGRRRERRLCLGCCHPTPSLPPSPAITSGAAQRTPSRRTPRATATMDVHEGWRPTAKRSRDAAAELSLGRGGRARRLELVWRAGITSGPPHTLES